MTARPGVPGIARQDVVAVVRLDHVDDGELARSRTRRRRSRGSRGRPRRRSGCRTRGRARIRRASAATARDRTGRRTRSAATPPPAPVSARRRSAVSFSSRTTHCCSVSRCASGPRGRPGSCFTRQLPAVGGADAACGSIRGLPGVWESIASQELGPTAPRIPSDRAQSGLRCPGWPSSEAAPLGPLAGEELRAARRLVARRELPLGRPDLPARQPAPARAARGRARQAAVARPLGHDARPQPPLGAPQPRHPRARPRRALRHGARARRARASSRTPTSRAPTASSTRRSAATSAACSSSSTSSRSRAGSRVIARRRRPDRSTRAASSATRSRTRSVRPSTTPA